MQVRTRLLVLTAMVVGLFTTGLWLLRLNQEIRLNSLLELRQSEVQKLTDRLITLRSQPLESVVLDYAFWNELGNFIETPTPDWARKNLSEAFDGFGVDIGWVFDARGNQVYAARRRGAQDEERFPLNGAEVVELFKTQPLTHFFFKGANSFFEVKGSSVVPYPEIEITPRGYFFVCRKWDGPYVDELASLLGGKAQIIADPAKHADLDQRVSTEKSLLLHHILPDAKGTPLAELHIEVPSIMAREVLRMADLNFYWGTLLGVMLLMLLWAILFNRMARPVSRIMACLDTGQTSFLEQIEHDRSEFGYIARMIRQYFVQNQTLLKEVQERERAQLACHRSDEVFKTLFDSIGDAVFIHNFEGRIIQANETACQRYGYSLEQFRDAKMDIIDPLVASGAFNISDALARAEEVGAIVFESEHVDAQGQPFPVEINLRKFHFNGVPAFLAVCRDTSERKKAGEHQARLEMQLYQAQKMESIGRLAGGVAHDFNNLLSPILGYAEILMTKVPPGDQMHDQLTQIRDAGQRAAALTSQLLAFSRKQVLTMQVLDINHAVFDFQKMLGRMIGEDVKLVTCLCATNAHVKADLTQLQQVIMNLAVNARDAMPDGGELTLETRDIVLHQDDVINEQSLKPGDYVLISMTDTGMGMDKGMITHIFEPFFTTKEGGKGTGLGLSMVYGIVKQHGGNVSVYSEPGMGTTFHIYLPRVENAVSDLAKLEEQQPPTGGSESVLVVEDEENVRVLVLNILQNYGYNVLSASTPEEAVELLEKDSQNIRLVLTDIVLPNMNGIELYQQLSHMQPDLKVLYMSGYTDQAVTRQGLSTEQRQFLQKPFSVYALARKVREVLDMEISPN